MSTTYSIVAKWKRFIQSVMKGDTPMNYDEINGKVFSNDTNLHTS